MYAFIFTATSENEILLRHKTSTRMFTTHNYVWPMNTLNPDYVVPQQFSKIAKGLNVNFVFTWVIPIACFYACVCACVAGEKQSWVKPKSHDLQVRHPSSPTLSEGSVYPLLLD